MGYERGVASRNALLLAIPAVVASGLFKLPDAVAGDGTGVFQLGLAFVTSYAPIAWLLRYVNHNSYLPFVLMPRRAQGAEPERLTAVKAHLQRQT